MRERATGEQEIIQVAGDQHPAPAQPSPGECEAEAGNKQGSEPMDMLLRRDVSEDDAVGVGCGGSQPRERKGENLEAGVAPL
jgi:hypothetical protein